MNTTGHRSRINLASRDSRGVEDLGDWTVLLGRWHEAKPGACRALRLITGSFVGMVARHAHFHAGIEIFAHRGKHEGPSPDHHGHTPHDRRYPVSRNAS